MTNRLHKTDKDKHPRLYIVLSSGFRLFMLLTKINLYFQEVFHLCCQFYKDEALSGHELFETGVWAPKFVVFDRR